MLPLSPFQSRGMEKDDDDDHSSKRHFTVNIFGGVANIAGEDVVIADPRAYVQRPQSLSNGSAAPCALNVPNLPDHFINREKQFVAFRELLLDYEHGVVALTGKKRSNMCVAGMAGIGKTVLASQLCKDNGVLMRFQDRILWIRIGKDYCRKLTRLQRTVLRFFLPHKEVKEVEDIESGIYRLYEASKNKRWTMFGMKRLSPAWTAW